MERRSQALILIPLVLFVLAFAASLYDHHLGRSVSYSDVSGMAVSLFFLCLALLALYAQLASRQRTLEERLNSETKPPTQLERSSS